jgi:hypothetical protein
MIINNFFKDLNKKKFFLSSIFNIGYIILYLFSIAFLTLSEIGIFTLKNSINPPLKSFLVVMVIVSLGSRPTVASHNNSKLRRILSKNIITM